MEREAYLSTYHGIEVLSPDGTVCRAAPLDGAGTLCIRRNGVLCAGEGGAIWQLDRRTLMPNAIFAGGPGVCELCTSRDGVHLYALLGDADSIIMMDACSGKPLFINRCGCNPRRMALLGNTLAVAGGESGRVYLFDPLTLEGTGEIDMPGPVYDVSIHGESLFALCLTKELSAALVKLRKNMHETIALNGMPGCFCMTKNALLAATEGWLYAFSGKDLCRQWLRRAPGRASALAACGDSLLLYDPLSECLFSSDSGAQWKMLRSGVKALARQL